MRKCIESMSEQKRKEMKRRDAERKREKRAAEKLKRNGGEYKTQAALGKARSKAMKALPSDPPQVSYKVQELIKFERCNLMLIIYKLFNRAQEVAIGVLKLVNKAVGICIFFNQYNAREKTTSLCLNWVDLAKIS